MHTQFLKEGDKNIRQLKLLNLLKKICTLSCSIHHTNKYLTCLKNLKLFKFKGELEIQSFNIYNNWTFSQW